jgi:hypothetical protein
MSELQKRTEHGYVTDSCDILIPPPSPTDWHIIMVSTRGKKVDYSAYESSEEENTGSLAIAVFEEFP